MLSTNSKRTGWVPESNATWVKVGCGVRWEWWLEEIPFPTTVWMVLKTLRNSGINPKNHLNTGVKQPGYHPNITPVLPTDYNGCLVGILINSKKWPYNWLVFHPPYNHKCSWHGIVVSFHGGNLLKQFLNNSSQQMRKFALDWLTLYVSFPKKIHNLFLIGPFLFAVKFWKNLPTWQFCDGDILRRVS